MQKPLLKLQWERFQAHVDLDADMAANMLAPYNKDAIEQVILLSEGCANTNYKITFKNNNQPLVIRIYMRDTSALQLEVAIHQFVKGKIPVPAHLYFDDTCTVFPYPYSVMEWIEGKLMREIIITGDTNAISECSYDAGKYLSILSQIKFSQSGFFENDLRIKPFSKDEEYLPYVLNLLREKNVIENLGTNLVNAIKTLVNEYAELFDESIKPNLTHSDYDPANILIKMDKGKHKIAAILDWEFAYSGTYYLDMGLMLRYSHRLPTCFEERFITSMKDHGIELSAQWKKKAKLMDLLCLLQLIHYNPVSERPNLNKDIVSLVSDVAINWKHY